MRVVVYSAYPKMPAGELMTRRIGSKWAGIEVRRLVHWWLEQLDDVHSVLFMALRQGAEASVGKRAHGLSQLHGESCGPNAWS